MLKSPVRVVLLLFALLLLMAFVIASIAIPNFPISPPERRGIDRLVGRREFNFLVWELDSLGQKIETGLVRPSAWLEVEQQQMLVLDYLDLIGEKRRLERELENIYTTSEQPEIDSAETRTQFDQTVAKVHRLQPVAEGILQQHVSDALTAEGFDILDGAWPPVSGRMTPLPRMLIISPRDRIKQEFAFALQVGIPIPDQDILENQIFEQFELSALVVPIGGLGIFPAMIAESSNITWLADVYAHEWAHHRLTLNPVGINYGKSAEMRTINETTASIVGNEIGRIVLETHYPAFVPPPPQPPQPDTQPQPEPDPPPFDFRAELNITRVRVDELLEAGRIEEAEQYMEERRQLFVANGINIRKLNQAYFAFYGGYAAEPGGAAGEDPVGPAVVALRNRSDSLLDFVQKIAPVTSFKQLEAILTNSNN